MAMEQLPNFMAAIRRLESGSFEGNYSARGVEVTRGQYKGERAYGAYQIMPGNWEAWSREAGLAGADMRDPKAQDAVAKFKFRQYYQQFGSWDLVAVAWFAGPGAARRAQKAGLGTLAKTSDDNGTSVPGYVSTVRNYMGALGTPSDSMELAAQRTLRGRAETGDDSYMDPNLEAMGRTAEPEPEVMGARAVGKEMVKMLSGLVRSQPGTGPVAHAAINSLFGFEKDDD